MHTCIQPFNMPKDLSWHYIEHIFLKKPSPEFCLALTSTQRASVSLFGKGISLH